MTAVPAPVSSTAAGALSAFLRGVERRALVVAELQCGDPARAEQTLVAVMRAFSAVASDLPMAQWPTRFWTLLGQRQALREPAPGQWPPALAALGGMAPLPRLALLLRVGGSLDENIATRVLDRDEAGDVAEIHRSDQTPDEILLLDEQHRAGLEAPHHQAAEQNGRRG
jgi:hypothetical protein